MKFGQCVTVAILTKRAEEESCKEKEYNGKVSLSYIVKKKSVDFTVKYLTSGCQFFYRYFYGRLPVEHF